MPRPNAPPTPASSSDIRGKEGTSSVSAFNLPPTAYQERADRASTSSATPSVNDSDSSYRPVSPGLPANASRKRPASHQAPVVTKDDFALPPPPTRSRTIIQMKPRESDAQDTAASHSANGKAGSQAGKRKQNNSGQTAAGRKIARKTAHSLIERRRRSKMNQEFGVLKDMIPACRGQEMHKLAILQASIEYLRYLEQCVADLQAKNISPHPQPPAPRRRQYEVEGEAADDEDVEDEEMQDDAAEPDEGTATPATSTLEKPGSIVSLPSLSQITTTTTTSPSIFSVGAGGQHYTLSSAPSCYSPYFHSNQASPAFGPQLHHLSTAPSFSSAFGLGSPALKPIDSTNQPRQAAEGATEMKEKHTHSQAQRVPPKGGRRDDSEHQMDQEATAALLMLTHDRRSWRAVNVPREDGGDSRSNGGMSVRELLSG